MAPCPRCRPLLALVVAAGIACAACDQRVEPYVPGERPEKPDLTRIFPEGAARARRNDEASAAEPGRGGRGAPSVAEEAGEPIRGSVVLAPEVAERVPAGAVLFLIVRHGDAGPPLAVKRIDAPRFPLPFEIGPDDRMVAGIPFAGPLRVTARVDVDGNATTRTPGDLQGAAAETVQPGASDVVVRIDRVL